MKPIRTLGALAITAAAAIGVASSASAAPTGQYSDFKYCPYTNTQVTQCVYSDTNGGAIKLGNSNVPIPSNKHLILQGGLKTDNNGISTWVNAVGADTLVKVPLNVPGGLVSMVSDNWFFGPLLDAFNNAISSFNGVTATAELVGPVKFDLTNLMIQSGTAVELPVRVKLDNPFLGDNCYIGSAASPVRFKLTTGTSGSLTGTPGTLSFNPEFTISTLTGTSLVDKTFTAPEATNCGNTVLDRWLVTLAVNDKIGLAAGVGASQAVMNGSSKLGSGDAVRTSAGL